MTAYQKVGEQIAAHVTHPLQKMMQLIHPIGVRFVVCGTSGSGKTRAIDIANELLEDCEQIAESGELLLQSCPFEAAAILERPDLAYEGYKHIGFNVFRSGLATSLEQSGVKVFWLDRGISPNVLNSAFNEN